MVQNSIVFLLALCSVRLITNGGGGVEATVAVSKNGSDLECSTWFVPVMSSGGSSYCDCGKDISGKVRCNNASHEIAILPGYCMSYDADLNQAVLGGCLYTETSIERVHVLQELQSCPVFFQSNEEG